MVRVESGEEAEVNDFMNKPMQDLNIPEVDGSMIDESDHRVKSSEIIEKVRAMLVMKK